MLFLLDTQKNYYKRTENVTILTPLGGVYVMYAEITDLSKLYFDVVGAVPSGTDLGLFEQYKKITDNTKVIPILIISGCSINANLLSSQSRYNLDVTDTLLPFKEDYQFRKNANAWIKFQNGVRSNIEITGDYKKGDTVTIAIRNVLVTGGTVEIPFVAVAMSPGGVNAPILIQQNPVQTDKEYQLKYTFVNDYKTVRIYIGTSSASSSAYELEVMLDSMGLLEIKDNDKTVNSALSTLSSIQGDSSIMYYLDGNIFNRFSNYSTVKFSIMPDDKTMLISKNYLKLEKTSSSGSFDFRYVVPSSLVYKLRGKKVYVAFEAVCNSTASSLGIWRNTTYIGRVYAELGYSFNFVQLTIPTDFVESDALVLLVASACNVGCIYFGDKHPNFALSNIIGENLLSNYKNNNVKGGMFTIPDFNIQSVNEPSNAASNTGTRIGYRKPIDSERNLKLCNVLIGLVNPTIGQKVTAYVGTIDQREWLIVRKTYVGGNNR